jgi:multidrug resistance protein, MATE family
MMRFFNFQEIKSFIKLCLPLIASLLAQKGMQFIDTLMMGWIGPSALAAGALATNVFITVLVFCRGLMSTVGVTIVHARSAGQNHQIASIVHQAFYLAFVLSIPAMLLTWQAPYYLVAMGQNPAVVADAQRLLNGLTLGIPGFMFFYVLREFISAFALARAVMIVCMISIPLTFIGNYMLIYGKFGSPAFGIAGIGYASAAVCWFLFCSLFFYCRRESTLKNYLTWQLSKPDYLQLKALWVGGFASGVIMVLDMIVFLSAALFTGYFGVAALAAYQIALQCTAIAYNLPLGVSIITALEVGRAYTEKNYSKVKRIAYLGLFSGLTISLTLSLLFVLAPRSIVWLFLPNAAHLTGIFTTAQQFLIAASLLLCFDGAQTIIIGALRGLRDTFTPMIISVLCYLPIGLGCAYLFAFHTPLGAVGIWYGLFLGIGSLSLIAGLRLRYRMQPAQN